MSAAMRHSEERRAGRTGKVSSNYFPLPTYDLVIENATIVDGTGAPGRVGSVAVRDDAIVAVGEVASDGAGRVVDGSGLVLAPGFN
jgi:N-acyl-D-aspartate/D-glutamate deacylase